MTVASEIDRRSATSALRKPEATQVMISLSRAVSRLAFADSHWLAISACTDGDIQMSPVQVLGELPQERGRRARATFPAADIGEVRKIAFQLIDILIADRHAPGTIVSPGSGRLKLSGKRLVIAHQAAQVMTQGDDTGAGQCRHVDHGGWLVAAAVGNGIAKHQTILL